MLRTCSRGLGFHALPGDPLGDGVHVVQVGGDRGGRGGQGVEGGGGLGHDGAAEAVEQLFHDRVCRVHGGDALLPSHGRQRDRANDRRLGAELCAQRVDGPARDRADEDSISGTRSPGRASDTWSGRTASRISGAASTTDWCPRRHERGNAAAPARLPSRRCAGKEHRLDGVTEPVDDVPGDGARADDADGVGHDHGTDATQTPPTRTRPSALTAASIRALRPLSDELFKRDDNIRRYDTMFILDSVKIGLTLPGALLLP